MAEEAVIRIVIEGGGGGDGNTPTDAPGPDRTFTARARRESTKSSEPREQTGATPTPSSAGSKVSETISQILEVSAVSALSELTAAVENVRENINTVAEEITSPKTIEVAGSGIANDTNKLPDGNGLEGTTELPDTLGPIDDVNKLINSLNEWSEVYEDLAEANERIVDSVEMVTPLEFGKKEPKELPEVIDAEFEVIEPPTPTYPVDYSGMIPKEDSGRAMIPHPGEAMTAPKQGESVGPHTGGGMGERPEFAWSGWPYRRNYQWTGWGGPGSGHGFPGPPPGRGVPTGWAGGPPGGGFNWTPQQPPFGWKGWQGPAASGTGMGAPPGGLTWHPGSAANGPFGAGGGLQGLITSLLPHAALTLGIMQASSMVKNTLKGVISSVGDATVATVGPNADAGKTITDFGNALGKAGEQIPIFGTDLAVAGEAVKVFGSVMQAINQTADRYGEFSPQIAQAQAIAEIRHTLGDLRRSREVSGEMVKYLIAQSDLQQKFEDVKVKILVKMLPVMTRILELIESVVPSGKGIEFQIGMLIDPMETMAKLFAEFLHMKKEENLPKIEDPTTQLFDPKFMNAAGIPGEWTPGN